MIRGGKTGWPPGLLQDDCRPLYRWFATRLDATHVIKTMLERAVETPKIPPLIEKMLSKPGLYVIYTHTAFVPILVDTNGVAHSMVVDRPLGNDGWVDNFSGIYGPIGPGTNEVSLCPPSDGAPRPLSQLTLLVPRKG